MNLLGESSPNDPKLSGQDTMKICSPMRLGAFSKIRQCCFLQQFRDILPSRMNVDQQKWLPFTWVSPDTKIDLLRCASMNFTCSAWFFRISRWCHCRTWPAYLDWMPSVPKRPARREGGPGTWNCRGTWVVLMYNNVANHCKPFGFFTAYRVTLRIVYSSVYHINRCQMYIVL